MSGGDWVVISAVAVTGLLAATGCLQWVFRMLMGAAVAVVLVTALSLSQSDVLREAREVVNDGTLAPAMAREVGRARQAIHRAANPPTPPPARPAEPPKIVIVTRRSGDAE